jgi:hypothetical protein
MLGTNNASLDWAQSSCAVSIAASRTLLAIQRWYPTVHQDVRQGVVRRFPYCVMYLVAEDAAIVVAVFHATRDPKVWNDLLLAARTPRGGATTNHPVTQWCAMAWTNSVAFPFLMNQPVLRRVGKVFTERLQ